MKMINIYIIVLLLLIFISSSLSCNDPLECLLESFSITIDSIIIPVDDNSNLEIDNFICNGFKLSSLLSSYKSITTIGIDIDGLAVGCNGEYKYEKLDGTIDATISNVEAIIDVSIAKEYDDIYPSAISFTSCNVPDGINTIKVDLKFSGSFKNIFNLLSGVVENYIKKSFDTIICTNLANFIAINGTEFIQNDLDPMLKNIISSKPSKVPDEIVINKNYIYWTNSIISVMYNMIDNFLNSNLLFCLEKSYPKLKEILTKPIVDYIVDITTNGTGIIDIKLPENNDIVILNGNYSLEVSSVSISGLDTFTEVLLLEPSLSSNISLNSKIRFDKLNVVVSSTFKSTDGNVYLHNYSEQLEFGMQLSNITLIFDVAVGIIKNDFNQLFVDQLFNLDCLFSSGLKYLNVTSLIMDVAINNISINQISGNSGELEKDLISLINNFNMLLNNGYGELITSTIAGIMQGPLRHHLNNLISIRQSSPNCPHHIEPASTDLIVWSESKLISATLIEPDVMNTVIDCITNSTGKLALDVGHWNLSVSNIDSFYEFSSLYPFSDLNKAYDIGTTLSAGQCGGEKCHPLSIRLDKQSSLSRTSRSLSSSMSSLSSITMMSITLYNLSLNLDTTLKIDKNAFRNLQLYQLSVQGCVASSVEEIKINSMELQAERVSASYVVNGNTITKNLTSLQTSPPSVDTYSLVDLLNSCIETELASSASTCANGGIPDTDGDDSTSSTNTTMIITVVAASGLVLGLLLFMLYRKRGSQRKKSDESSSTVLSAWDFSESLISHTHTSLFLRIVLLLLILGNISLFVVSNSNREAVAVLVDITSTIGDNTIVLLPPTPVFYFDLIHTVRDMWRAKAYILASLIAFFTGFWPYVKLLFMLAAYTLPSSMISINKRDSRLKLLEILGKWSLIDFFVMTLFMIGFHFNINVSNLSAKVKVVPNAGFYEFVISTGLSLVLGHLLLAFHRKSINHPFLEAPANVNGLRATGENDFKERLVDTVFHVSIRRDDTNINGHHDSQQLLMIKLTKRMKNVLAWSIFAVFCFGTLSLIWETIDFKVLGLVGLLLGPDSEKKYSLMSLGNTLPSIVPNDRGLMCLQFTFFLLVLVMPLALLATITTLAFVPLPLWKQRYLFIGMEIFNAWASFDVFLVASTAALMQIVQLTEYMIGDSCDGINVYLKKYLDVSLDGDDVCIDLIFRFTSNAWVIFMAGISLFVLSTACLKLFDKGIHERINLLKKSNRHIQSASSADNNNSLFEENGSGCSDVESTKALMVDISLESEHIEDNGVISNPINKDDGVKLDENVGLHHIMKGDDINDSINGSNISIHELNDIRATLFRNIAHNHADNDEKISKFKLRIIKILMTMKLLDVSDLHGNPVNDDLQSERLMSIHSSSFCEQEGGVGVSPIIN